MQTSHYDYQAIALKKLAVSQAFERVDYVLQKNVNKFGFVHPDDRPVSLSKRGENPDVADPDVPSNNRSEDRKKNRMKDERSVGSRDATNRDSKRNPKDFNPGKKAAAPNENDDPVLHKQEEERALNQARHDVMDALNGIPPQDQEVARKGNDETRRDRERRDRNQNLPFADQRRERGTTPVSSRTATARKDGIIDAIENQLKNRIHRPEDRKKRMK
jgi:hypothetical protein